MFAACLYDKFARAAWSGPGVVFDEKRANVNYWEPWYLCYEPGRERKAGIPTEQNPRTGACKRLVEAGHDLHELHALMAPRPFLVSGGASDPGLAALPRLAGESGAPRRRLPLKRLAMKALALTPTAVSHLAPVAGMRCTPGRDRDARGRPVDAGSGQGAAAQPGHGPPGDLKTVRRKVQARHH
jgi:hypothetical protein